MSGVMRHTMVVRNPDTMEAVALLKGEELPDWAADLVHEDNLESAAAAKAADSGSDDSGSTGGTDYASMKVDELKDEIEKRNDGREDDAKLSTAGNKGDLVATLEADDAAKA